MKPTATALVSTLVALFSSHAFALSIAEFMIYDSLNAPAIRLEQSAANYQKSVGGLVCESYGDENPPAASCTLSGGERDDEAIYRALQVQAQNVTMPGIVGSVRFEKAIGALSCTMSHPVVPNPPIYYECRFR